MVLTSLAGITMNLILAFVSCGLYMLVIKFSYLITNAYIMFLLESFFFQMYIINLSLMVFNLLPIPPLDGFNAISAVAKYNNKFVQFMQSYGSIILILLLVFFDGLLMQLISWVSLPLNMFWNWIIF